MSWISALGLNWFSINDGKFVNYLTNGELWRLYLCAIRYSAEVEQTFTNRVLKMYVFYVDLTQFHFLSYKKIIYIYDKTVNSPIEKKKPN